ncbi:MAG: hypothetical protein Ct9H300mP8_03190 [Gammaproteobacteria bacterium]|nr:MAG: hypothetical protein Ct9H300mP8_03190 [Gammaproteobacteria bacterium]
MVEMRQRTPFPLWGFYNALRRLVGLVLRSRTIRGSGRGITEASIVLEEVAASGAAMNGANGIHLSILDASGG